MKKAIYFSILLAIIFACRKEKGKEPYELIFTFNSGETLYIEGVIHERRKDPGKLDLERKKEIKKIYFRKEYYPEIGYNLGLALFKTEQETLLGLNTAYLKLDNASFASGQNLFLEGILEMEGPYTRKGIKFIVDNGTFTYNWNNAPDYGESVQVLSGTWTLKRK